MYKIYPNVGVSSIFINEKIYPNVGISRIFINEKIYPNNEKIYPNVGISSRERIATEAKAAKAVA